MGQCTSNDLRGVGVALVTPFAKDGLVDYTALDKLVNHCIVGGCSYLVALGTTGETATLSMDEQQVVLNKVISVANGRIPVIAGLGGNDTQDIIQRIPLLNQEGVAGFLSSSPHYNKPSQEGIFRHYMAIAEASPKPIILYNVPSRTAQSMDSMTVIRLAEASKTFIGIKEASGNLSQAMRIIAQAPDDFALISGDDFLTLPLIALGATGVISVAANAFPKSFSHLVRAALNYDLNEAQKLQVVLNPFFESLFEENNPGGIKCALESMGLIQGHLRLPLIPVSEKNQIDIQNALRIIAEWEL
ncbi:MAG TPA: 4-hydroxy-tetrahydrodipicolinate synthase [Bacteroidetes bacterium]|nr:4-hydroxy-tetrahydrodipicolinate synthase [Bacteroidota bacterium]